MRGACRLVRQVLQRCREVCRVGATTAEIDGEAEEILAQNENAVGLFKNYPTYKPGEGFPALTCISMNEEVVHGIPGDRRGQAGDLVSIDFGCRIDGWCGDAATTVMVEPVSEADRRLCQVTEHVLQVAIENIRPGRRWSRVAGMMAGYAEQAGMGVVKDFVGHGIGQTMHEEPKVPNFVNQELLRNDIELAPGMVLAVEPMCSLGRGQVKVLADKWTVVTVDGQSAAHYEHTIAVTDDGCEVLTDGSRLD